jgi:hypothetical protein
MRPIAAICFCFIVSITTLNAQTNKEDYSNEELLKIPVEAAFYLFKKDDYSLTKFLTEKNGLEYNLQKRSGNNYFEFTRILKGNTNERDFYSTTINGLTIIADKRLEKQFQIEAFYLKTNYKKENLSDKSFFDFLQNHPKLYKQDGKFMLIIRGEDKIKVKAVIGIIPDYFAALPKYNVLFFDCDDTIKIEDILKNLSY